MSVLFSDDFNRADEVPASGNWSSQPGWSGGMAIRGNQLGGETGSGDASYVNSVTPPADQYAQLRIKSSSLQGGGPCVSMDTAHGSYYCLQFFGGNPGTLDLFREQNAGYGSLGQVGSVPYSIGDILRIEREGSTVRGYLNGVLKITATDSALLPGRFGAAQFGVTGAQFDDFEGGSLANDITGSFSSTEGADTASFSGARGHPGTLSAVEAADIALFSGKHTETGVLFAVEAADIATFTGTKTNAPGNITGVLAVVEASDRTRVVGRNPLHIPPQLVKSSTRLWSQEVAAVRALEQMDSAGVSTGVAALLDSREPGYEWSNGRRFATPKNPYE